ncbi:MAG TPA: hypothetical protein VLA09_00530 [Longimicrobiales bacterium]|nr:hypothetical protein [Longimicrobiales bacterium]
MHVTGLIMRITGALAVSLIAAGCATTPAASNDPVTRDELAATEATFVYDALRDVRASWLRRTVDAPEMGVVVRRGGPPPSESAMQCTAMAYIGRERARADDLRRLLVAQVREVRLIPARAARPDGSRCSHDRPAIHVVTVVGT